MNKAEIQIIHNVFIGLSEGKFMPRLGFGLLNAFFPKITRKLVKDEINKLNTLNTEKKNETNKD